MRVRARCRGTIFVQHRLGGVDEMLPADFVVRVWTAEQPAARCEASHVRCARQIWDHARTCTTPAAVLADGRAANAELPAFHRAALGLKSA